MDIIAGIDLARERFPGQRTCIKHCAAFGYHAVYRHSFARADNNCFTRRNLLRLYGRFRAAADDRHGFGLQFHHRFDRMLAPVHCDILEKLANLVEQHHADSLRIILEEKRADGGDEHQKMLIQQFAVEYPLESLDNHIVCNGEVGNKEQSNPHKAGIKHNIMINSHRRKQQDNTRNAAIDNASLLAFKLFHFWFPPL